MSKEGVQEIQKGLRQLANERLQECEKLAESEMKWLEQVVKNTREEFFRFIS